MSDVFLDLVRIAYRTDNPVSNRYFGEIDRSHHRAFYVYMRIRKSRKIVRRTITYIIQLPYSQYSAVLAYDCPRICPPSCDIHDVSCKRCFHKCCRYLYKDSANQSVRQQRTGFLQNSEVRRIKRSATVITPCI